MPAPDDAERADPRRFIFGVGLLPRGVVLALRFRREQLDALAAVPRATLPARVACALREAGASVEADDDGRSLRVEDRVGGITSIALDPDGRPARAVIPAGRTFAWAYDPSGAIASVTGPEGRRVNLDHDGRGRTVRVAGPSGAVVLDHDPAGAICRITWPDGRSRMIDRDPIGRVTRRVDRAGAETRIIHESGAAVVDDPLGRRSVFRHDADRLLTAIDYPDGSTQRFRLDESSPTLHIRNRDGRDVAQTFDERGFVSRLSWSDGASLTFAFDEAGELARAENRVGTLEFARDAQGRLVSETNDAGVTSVAYDEAGQVVGITNHRGESIAYEYDSDGLLAAIVDWDGGRTLFDHGPHGRLRAVRHPSGLTEHLEHAPLGRLTRSRVVTPGGATVSLLGCRYDRSERLAGQTDIWGPGESERRSRDFEYDAEDRVVAERSEEGGPVRASYGYDLKGNLVRSNRSEIAVGPMDEPVRYDGLPIRYDSNGNMVGLPLPGGEELRASFGPDGLLRAVDVSGRVTRYAYDALGRRVEKTDGEETTRFGWLGPFLIWEECRPAPDAEPIRRDYLYAPHSHVPIAFREGARTYRLQADARGAIVRAFDDDGRVVWRALYDTFGRASIQVEEVRQPFRLMGHYHDEESGLHYNLARYYSPIVKSYLSLDPRWFLTGSTNYSYAANDPWNLVDPYGTAPAPVTSADGKTTLTAGVTYTADPPAPTAGPSAELMGNVGMFAPLVIGGVLGFVLGGPPGAALGLAIGGVVGSVLGPLAGEMTKHLQTGQPFCMKCFLTGVGINLALDAAFAGVGLLLKPAAKLLGKIPIVKKLAIAAAEKGAKLAGPLARKLAPLLAKAKNFKGILKKGASDGEKVSEAMTEKILYGESKPQAPREIKGGHSPRIKSHPDYNVNVLSTNTDGTTKVKFRKKLADGSMSKPKTSTLAPDSWSDGKILEATEQTSSKPPYKTETPTSPSQTFKEKTFHKDVIDGVEWETIKEDGKVTSSYPTGGPKAPGGN